MHIMIGLGVIFVIVFVLHVIYRLFCGILELFGVSEESAKLLAVYIETGALFGAVNAISDWNLLSVCVTSCIMGLVLLAIAILNGGCGSWFIFLLCVAVAVISILDCTYVYPGLLGTVWDWTLKIVPWVLGGIVAIIVVIALIYFIYQKIDDMLFNKRYAKEVEEWLAKPTKNFTEHEIIEILRPFSDKMSEVDKNENRKFSSNIPFGRTNCFLNYFDKSIDIEEPLYYSPVRSKDELELREYGLLFTDGGIYVLEQVYDSENSKYVTRKRYIDFNGLMEVWYNKEEKCLYLQYPDVGDIRRIKKDDIPIPLSYIKSICQIVIDSGISRSLYKEKVFKDGAALAERKFEGTQNVGDISRGANIGASAVASANNIGRYEYFGNLMNARQGGGYAAEFANDTFDRLNPFNKVEHLGQVRDESGRIIKGGADRRVNGVNYQTKYHKSAKESVDALFKDGKPKYLNPDGSMMVAEMARDQYDAKDNSAIEEMEKHIAKGEVPGAKKGDGAKYVKKGILTYNQGQNTAKSGCIESLTFDAANGVICSVPAATITAMITFASAVWNGMDTEQAVKESFSTFANVVGKAALQAMIIGQLGHKDIARVFVKQTKSGYLTVANPLYGVSDKIATKVSSSALAKSSIGKSLKLDAVNGKKLIGGTVMLAFTFGPDICRALVGRISLQQLFKNSCIGAAGLVGASIGQAVIPIPVVGGIIGGAVGGFIAKKTLDNFIEDDAKEMYQILKEEFLDVVMIAGLNKEEFEYVIEKTFGNKKLPHILRDMYQYGDAREYARERVVSEAVVGAYSKRKKITEKMYRKAIFNVAKKTYNEMYPQMIDVEFEDIENDDYGDNDSTSMYAAAALPAITVTSAETVLNQKMPDKAEYEKVIKDAVGKNND